MQTTDVIIVAAGSGTRFGAPKQLSQLLGKPLYRHSLDVFASHELVRRIVLVVSDDVRTQIADEVATVFGDGRIEIVLGGETRQASVSNGLAQLSIGIASELVLVHDAARPGIDVAVITAIVEAIDRHGAALAAIPVVDTLKRESDGFSAATISRASLWRAQTPQGARRVLLLKAVDEARIRGYEGTDEAEVLERAGVAVKLVLGNERMMKVTYPDDLERVALLLRR